MLFINTLFLAISSSIDSFGIGITYGLRKTKLSKMTKLILFVISMIVTLISGIIGNLFKFVFSTNISEIIGAIILIFMGFFIIIQTRHKEYSFDFDNSNDININEAFALGLALSLDSLCIGIGVSAIGINIFIFSILVAFLQYVFLSLGHFLGIHLSSFKLIPQSIWTEISGILLILIGFFRLF
jgi:putative Mn2+ efflux pump MntP